MFAVLSRRIPRCSLLTRTFAKVPEMKTKYNVLTIPSLRDNFCIWSCFASDEGYILSTMDTRHCVVIDPIIPKYIEDAISTSGYELKALLATHHHV